MGCMWLMTFGCWPNMYIECWAWPNFGSWLHGREGGQISGPKVVGLVGAPSLKPTALAPDSVVDEVEVVDDAVMPPVQVQMEKTKKPNLKNRVQQSASLAARSMVGKILLRKVKNMARIKAQM